MIRTLMLIDEDEEFRARFKSNLEKKNDFMVIATGDAENAVTLAPNMSPDFILLDVLMPWLYGLEVQPI